MMMDKSQKYTPTTAEESPLSPHTGDAALIEDAKEFYKLVEAIDGEDWDDALRDLEFSHGKQWNEELKLRRESNGRPCHTFNRQNVFIDRITGAERQNRPGAAVYPMSSEANEFTAQCIEDIIRTIESRSSADAVYDWGGEQAARCARGAFRITTEYCDDESFDQWPVIRRIKNVLSVRFDQNCQREDGLDAKRCMIETTIERKEFEREYGHEATVANWIASSVTTSDTATGTVDKVKIAEYWRVEFDSKENKTIARVKIGEEIQDIMLLPGFTAPEGSVEIARRVVKTPHVRWYIIGDDKVLKRGDWPGKYIPIIMVSGKEGNINGKTVRRSVWRDGMSAQEMENYWWSAATEATGLMKDAPWQATEKMVEGYETLYSMTGETPNNLLLYRPDADAPGLKPTRVQPPNTAIGLAQNAMNCIAIQKDLVGIHDSSLGKESNETSGIGIQRRQEQSDTINYAFPDNLNRAIAAGYEVLVDLIPKVIDTDRYERLLGKDRAERFVALNAYVNTDTGERVDDPFGDDGVTLRPNVLLNDLALGKYGVKIVTGPNYMTQREQAISTFEKVIAAAPDTVSVLLPEIFENLDMSRNEELSDEIRGVYGRPPKHQKIDDPGASDIATAMNGGVPVGQEQEQAPEQAQDEFQQEAQQEAQQEMAAIELEIKRQELAGKVADAEEKKAAAKLKVLEVDMKTMEVELKQREISGGMVV
jgi:hypothetical protein